MWLVTVIAIFATIKIVQLLFSSEPYITVSKAQHSTSTAYLDKLDKNIGITTPNCPYCGIDLPKFPGRKTKCKSCDNYIFVRTRPADGMRILIREEQIEAVSDEWAKKNGTYEIVLQQRAEFESVKQELIKIRKSEKIPEKDIYWNLYQKKRLEAAKENNWGDYSFYAEEMAELLYEEKKYKGALEYYLENAYFEICLCGSADEFSTKKLIKQYIQLANSRVNYEKILECIELTNVSIEQTEEIFMKMIIINAPFPLTKQEAWKIIAKNLY